MMSSFAGISWLSGLSRRISRIQAKRGWSQGRKSRSHFSGLIGWHSSSVGPGRLFEKIESLEERALLSTTCAVAGGTNAENLFDSDGSADANLKAGSTLTDAQREAIEEIVRDSTNQIGFEKNMGQFPEGVSYGFRTTFGGMLVYQDHVRLISKQTDSVTRDRGQQVVDINFTGSNARWAVVPGGASEVLGSYQQVDGTALRPEIFNEVTLRNVYDGVDLRLYSADRGILEFDWIVAQAQDYGQIRIAANGQDNIVFHDDGSATFDLRFQDLSLKIPETYQVIDGVKHPLDARMVAGDTPGEIRYTIADDIVNDQPLVIDPNVAWSTYFNLNSATFDQYLFAVAVNANGVYAFGLSDDRITNGSFGNYMQVNAGFSQGTAAAIQAYIYRLDGSGTNITAWTSTVVSTTPSDLELFPDGRVLAGFSDGMIQIYSADLATRSFSGEPVTMSVLHSLAIVNNNSFYIGGLVASAIPIVQIADANIGPDATFAGSSEGVIIRYSNATTTPTPDWATYVGGSDAENFTAIAMTPNLTKLAFAVNSASTSAFPGLVNEVDDTQGGTSELLVGVLNEQAPPPATFDVFSYLGGSSTEGTAGAATAEIVATNSYFYVGGNTASTDLPGTTGGAQTSNGGGVSDLFMSQISLGGGTTGFQSTYAGGTGTETIGGLAYDLLADKVLFFATSTGSFPTQNTTPVSTWFDSIYGGGLDIVVATYSRDLTTKEFASYIGGGLDDYLGSGGTLIGQGHLTYSNVTGLTYVGTTIHSGEATLDPAVMSGVPGKDKTKNVVSNQADAHFLIAFNSTTFDFGDAPVSYESGNPARESASALIRIGATVDSEGTPFASGNADGDDLIDSGAADDEDGVASLPLFGVYSTTYSVTVSVFNNTGAVQALLGWIDLNLDGTFQASESATVSVPNSVFQQNVVLNWAGLSGLVGGQSYLRLRLTDALLTDNSGTAALDERSTGIGSIGEVEDYSLSITNPVLSVIGDTVSEADGIVVFTVRLSVPSVLPISVNYATEKGTAVPGDYLSKRGTLLFRPGETQKTLTIKVLEDTRYEGPETFEMALTGPKNATLANGQDRAGCTINDNDAAPTLTISDKSVTEGTSNTPSNMIFTVRLSAASGLPVTVDYATLVGVGTAIASDDYTAVPSTSLVIAAGKTSKTITVQIVGDALDEIDLETFVVELSSPVDATLADAQGTGTIKDNDLPPKVRIDSVTQTEGTVGFPTVLTFTLTLSAASNLPVTAFFDTVDGTAKDGIDYIGIASGSYTFNPGTALSTTINVSIISDPSPEKTKTFVLNLKNAIGSVFAKGIGTILDN